MDQKLTEVTSKEKQCCENGNQCSNCNKENLGKHRNKMTRKIEEPEVFDLCSDEDEDCKEECEKSDPHTSELEEDGIAHYIMEDNQSQNYTTLQCQWIRIGSYKATPKDRVFIDDRILRMMVPCHNSKSKVKITIEKHDLINVTYNYSENENYILLFITPNAATKIQKVLKMEASEINLDPENINYKYKIIIFKLEKLTEENKISLEKIFDEERYHQLEKSALDDILVNVCYDGAEGTKQILIYPPPPEKYRISITLPDYKCLAVNSLLNDIIIDFYLKYIHIQMSPNNTHVHIFSTFFFNSLTGQSVQSNKTLTEAERRHARVANWTKDVNLFEKDFIIIPINQEAHWFLAIIVYPGLEEPVNVDGNIKQPLILIFDSLLEANPHTKTIDTLREYLQVEFKRKVNRDRTFDEVSFPGAVFELLPQQTNLTDCGVFLLQYVESFLITKPIPNFDFPLPDLSDWFDATDIPEKRKDIAITIMNLIKEQGHELYEVGPLVDFYDVLDHDKKERSEDGKTNDEHNEEEEASEEHSEEEDMDNCEEEDMDNCGEEDMDNCVEEGTDNSEEENMNHCKHEDMEHCEEEEELIHLGVIGHEEVVGHIEEGDYECIESQIPIFCVKKRLVDYSDDDEDDEEETDLSKKFKFENKN